MTVLSLVLGGTIFTAGGHYSPVNNVLGGQYSLVNSPVNNVRGDIFGGDTVHYDTGATSRPAVRVKWDRAYGRSSHCRSHSLNLSAAYTSVSQ